MEDSCSRGLRSVYARITSLKEQPTFPGLSGTGNSDLQKPCIQLHLRDVTVRNLLDAISLESIKIAPIYDRPEGPGVVLQTIQPTSWQAQLPPADLPLKEWRKQLFTPY